MPVKYSVIPSTHLDWHRPPAELVKEGKAGDTNLSCPRAQVSLEPGVDESAYGAHGREGGAAAHTKLACS